MQNKELVIGRAAFHAYAAESFADEVKRINRFHQKNLPKDENQSVCEDGQAPFTPCKVESSTG